MERVLFFIVALAMFNVAATAEDNATLEELFVEQYGQSMHAISLRAWSEFTIKVDHATRSSVELFSGRLNWLPLTMEIILYLREITFKIMSEFEYDLSNITLQSIYKDLNGHCAEYLETPIMDLTVKPNNVTCVIMRLRKTLTGKLKTHITVGLQKLSRECIQQLLDLCSAVHANCTLAYEGRVGKLLGGHIEDASEVQLAVGSTPLQFIRRFFLKSLDWVSAPFASAYSILTILTVHISSAPSIEPFTFQNLIRPQTKQDVEEALFKLRTTTQSREQLTWGIVRSDAGSVGLPCSNYREIYHRDSEEFSDLLYRCHYMNVYQSTFDLLRCAYTDLTSIPLTWTTAPSAYFHSQCLCLAYNGTECGVNAPKGVDPRIYCLSVLLRDFQRQVTYRPAVTYIDYAFQTRVPVCKFTNILQIGFKSTCKDTEDKNIFNMIQSVQCYFKGLVNKQLNCSETALVNTYNATELCVLQLFMEFVFCDCEGDDEVPVPYYGAGYSTVVLFLTYLDVAVRVLTLFTYLACPQLRNLPGKLLIGYQVTALLRLLVVRASLVDMALAVRFDVAMDLASTLWLTSYLHFLTTSIMALRLPDSLSRDEARMVLLCYALFGWTLPAALSAAFFGMDETLDSRVHFGQLLFVLCNYVALFGNIYMFYKNCQFYYDVKKSALQLREGVTARSVYADLFNFALKTSLLSGAGITFRLLFAQIQGLEHVLGYYHALSTLQGLLFFVLYGCNSEARAFWKLVVFTKLALWCRRENTVV